MDRLSVFRCCTFLDYKYAPVNYVYWYSTLWPSHGLPEQKASYENGSTTSSRIKVPVFLMLFSTSHKSVYGLKSLFALIWNNGWGRWDNIYNKIKVLNFCSYRFNPHVSQIYSLVLDYFIWYFSYGTLLLSCRYTYKVSLENHNI